MSSITIIDDLYRYNSWANQRIFALCEGLAEGELDQTHEMGYGSLRNTMFHILAAEEVWLERWQHAPWRPVPQEAEGLPLAEIQQRLARVAAAREALLEPQRPGDWQSECSFKDSQGNAYRMRLKGLLMQVANHGIHHRAQALQILKRLGRTVPGGLDYLFFRFAKPNLEQEPATIEAMRKIGLEVATGTSPAVAWDASLIGDYFAYGDWANDRLLSLIGTLDDAALDRSWNMGIDTLRKTALHLADAERWWMRNWTAGPTQFERAPETTSINELKATWAQIIAERGQFLTTIDADSAQRVINGLVGQMSIRVPLIVSLVQLCGHGTHHRAQLTNMLRRSGITAPGNDYVIWRRQTTEP